MTEPFVNHLMAVSSEYGDAMREAAAAKRAAKKAAANVSA
jgi:hypothetical protein